MADPARPGPPTAPQTERAQAISAIRRMLAKLRAPAMAETARRRPLAGQPPLGLVSAIVEEIDETVMARTLVLRNANGEEVQLGVCNRRLLHAEVPGEQAARNLTYAGGGDLAALRAALERFCAPGDVTLEAAPASGSATLEQTGVAVATLRDAWESVALTQSAVPAEREARASGAGAGPVPGADRKPAPSRATDADEQDADEQVAAADWERLRAFCAACEGEADAILAVAASGAEFRSGDAARTGALATALHGSGAGLLSGPEGAVLLEAEPEAPALLLAMQGAERAILRLRPGWAAVVLARWAARFGAD